MTIFEAHNPRVFSIEPYDNFLAVLAENISQSLFSENQFSSDAVIFLPTRRAARHLARELMKVRPQQAIILPRIRTLGDIDPEEIDLKGIGGYLDFQPTISPQRKIFELAKLVKRRDEVLEWSKDANNAINGAMALADLLDSAELMATGEDGPDWDKLSELADEEWADINLSEHWKKSTEFLEIVTHAYPAILAEMGLIDPSTKRRRSIEILAKNWEENPPNFPVIIAGSTGSVPAARELMRVVANLPKGCVILPGVDKSMSPNAWENLEFEHGHPQRILWETIRHLDVDRANIEALSGGEAVDNSLLQRRKILNIALSPKEHTADWINQAKEIGAENAKLALNGISLLEAASEEEEASAIAIIMREALETKDKTCALISPNQQIAQRVAEKMQKWGVEIDISSGIPFDKSPLGMFIELVAAFVIAPSDPKTLMALLAHPFSQIGMEWAARKNGIRGLEIALLRGAARDADLRAILARAEALSDDDWKYKRSQKAPVMAILNTLIGVHAEIIALKPILTISGAAEFLLKSCEIIARNSNSKSEYIWGKAAGNLGAGLFASIIEDGAGFAIKSLEEGFRIIANLMARNVVRPQGAHPNLAILGPLEARLVHFDKYILAGLDEGIWPQPAPVDPFLSRPMRAKLGLQPKDLRMGLAAHDFAQLAANREVVLTRSAKRGGAPSVPSRWLWRLKTLLAGAIGVDAKTIEIGDNLPLKLVAASQPIFKDQIKAIVPAPKPPVSARPTMYSATQIESLIRDPYKIYVQKVLDLQTLEGLGGEISVRERGSAIHEALEIIADWNGVPNDAHAQLMRAFEEKLRVYGYEANELPIELERLSQTAQMMIDFQKSRTAFKVNVEQKIEAQLEIKGAQFTIKAKSDRIDVDAKGNAEIWDFKTGKPPTDLQISSLLSPQLPVTAWILEQSNALGARKVIGFGHIHVGNRTPDIVSYKGKQKYKKELLTMPEIIGKTDTTLREILALFHDDNQAYKSKPRVEFIYKGNWEDLTDRLARRAEWADAAGDDND